jgi:hypothetical protein
VPGVLSEINSTLSKHNINILGSIPQDQRRDRLCGAGYRQTPFQPGPAIAEGSQTNDQNKIAVLERIDSENALTAIGVSGAWTKSKQDAHDPAMISFGNGHVLQQPHGVTDDGYMNILPGQVVKQGVK